MNHGKHEEPFSGSAWVLALLFGAVVGTLQQAASGFIVGGLIGYLLGRVSQLNRQVIRLSQHLQKAGAVAPPAEPGLQVSPWPREAAPVAADAAATPQPPPRAAAAEAPPPSVSAASTSTAAPPEPPPAIPLAPTPGFARSEPSALGRAIDRGWAWLRGGNPLARAGIVILFFGAAYLAKYAAEHTVVPIELRFAFIAAGAMVLLLLGWRLRARKRVYAHILQGGGIAGLYLTVFAATRLYDLLPSGFALALMVVVAVISAILAVAQSALALAVIGTAGGFLAPILVSTGDGNHVALFSCYTALNLGVFTVAWFRAWRVLNLTGFVFTFGVAGLFRATAYAPEKMLGTDGFLVLFFLMYATISVLFSLRRKPDLRGYVSGSLVFGLPVAAFTLHATLVAHIEYALAWSALGLGAFYLALAWLLLRSGLANLRLLSEAFVALGVIFASLAVPLGFDTRTTAAMWAVEGAGLLWLGIRQHRALARAFGLLLQVFAGGAYLMGFDGRPAETPLLNSVYIGTVLIAVSGALSAWWLARGASTLKRYERWSGLALLLWAALWWVLGGIAEIHRAWPLLSLGGVLALFAASCALFERLGRRADWPALRRLALALLVPAVMIGLLQSAQLSHPFARAGAAGWPLLLVAAYGLLWRFDHLTDAALGAILPVFHAAAGWTLALVMAWETGWQTAQQVGGVWPQLPWGLVPAALLWLLGARRLRPAWPLAQHESAYRVVAALPLAVYAGLWVLAMNLGSNGDSAPLVYVPLLNPLDIAVALILAALIRYERTMRVLEPGQMSNGLRRLLFAVVAALAFVWLSAALLRALHYALGTPLHAAGVARSTVAQAALSIFWSLLGFGAMVLASRRGWRAVWIVGAALMAVVVFKLFFVDTVGRGTLARIVSFLVVGVLLLVTGYVSPLPPPRRQESSA